MIKQIYVDGFKTLSDFSLTFQPGLNVLVGPNGSGKTNIVTFFEFLDHLLVSDASEATSRVGGAGSIFRRSDDKYQTEINATITGCFKINPDMYMSESKKRFLNGMSYCLYSYTFVLFFPESRDTVYYKRQELRYKYIHEFVSCDTIAEHLKDWALDVTVEIDASHKPIVQARSLKEGALALPEARSAKKTDKTERLQALQSLVDNFFGPNTSLVTRNYGFIGEFWEIGNDLSGGQIFNIVPSAVKLVEDSAKPPGLDRDGAGLAATLYLMKRISSPGYFEPRQFFSTRRNVKAKSDSLETLKSYLALVNDVISDIDVENDSFNNQLKVRFLIKSNKYKAWIPLAGISDGTLKWIALIAAALTEGSVFSIEEPENYLHPKIQSQIVVILREILFHHKPEVFTVLTTHSETLLNNCRPQELIMVSFEDGRSIAKRCSNAEEVSNEISRTGFGLGYYYVNDALQT